ncbi:MAG: hypothetical protein RBU23_11320 [Candidatus Auribacterota bacterium]|jgi:hypothetical protein|nr:hypothetical protein [Candidatus Auribacterota bacterium]
MKKKQVISLSLFIAVILIGFLVYSVYSINRLERSVRDIKSKNEALRKTIERLRAENKRLKLISDCNKIEKKVEKIRGLHAKKSIDYEMIEKKSLRKMLDQKFNEAYPGTTFEYMESAFKILGILQPDIDMKNLVMRLYDEQVAAFYDYVNKKLYMVDSSLYTPSIRDMFLAHELTHMLQDQHYDLIGMGIDDNSNDDRSMALSSLLEGDATRCMTIYYTKNAGLSVFLDVALGVYMELKQSEIDKAPAFLKETMLFPYMKGLVFVMALYETQDQDTIHNVFLDPPVSTEQIIHPEKYFADRDDPVIPQLPCMKEFYESNGLVELYENTMGEFVMDIWLKSYISAGQARTASEGWGGDRYKVFHHPSNTDLKGYVLQTNWDTPQDAQEFAGAYRSFLEKKYDIILDQSSDSVTSQYVLPNDCHVHIKHADITVTVVYASRSLFLDVLGLFESD